MKYNEIYKCIEQSKRILITSHYSPDPDSIGSALYVYNVLVNNLTDKNIRVCIEGQLPNRFSFLKGFADITNMFLVDCVKEHKPDLLIMLDGNNYKRFAKLEEHAFQIAGYIKSNSTRTIIIDHHLEDGKDDVDIYVNNKCSSTSEEVYKIFTKDFSWKTDKSDMESVLFGIIGDTGRFLYKNNFHRETFNVVSDMIDVGLSIEELQGRMSSLTAQHIKIISELMRNLEQKDDYNFSYLSDEFTQELITEKVGQDVYNSAYHLFMDQYIRNINPNKWGFVLIPDMNAQIGAYKGSFRAVNDLLDTTVFAKILEGGGHKPASGFKVSAKSYKEALDIVHKTILDNKIKAYENR